MKPSEAARIIGVSVKHIRHLISIKRLPAKRVRNNHAWYWDIPRTAVLQYRDRGTDGRGWPRGKPRSTTPS